jgi:hypothetical protein
LTAVGAVSNPAAHWLNDVDRRAIRIEQAQSRRAIERTVNGTASPQAIIGPRIALSIGVLAAVLSCIGVLAVAALSSLFFMGYLGSK